jgi:hypothetical protein
MKKLIFFLGVGIVMFCLSSCGGTMTVSDSAPIVKVVPVENATKDELYVRANNWMVGVFNNAESVIQFSDKESGNITGKYFLSPVIAPSQYGPGKNAYALINIQVKDGASKITITPEEFQYMKGNMFSLYDEESSKLKINGLVNDFQTSIVVPEDKNWGTN